MSSTGTVPAPTTGELLVEVLVGTPAPQGSKSYKGMRAGKPVLVESSAAVGPWREAVAWAVRAAITRGGWICTTGPVSVEIDFYLARPVSAPKRRTRPDRRPDLDKLVRSTLDALTTAGAIDDDARVVEIIARKHYAESWCGARITVRTEDRPEPADLPTDPASAGVGRRDGRLGRGTGRAVVYPAR